MSPVDASGEEDRRLTILLIPHGGRETRALELSYARLRRVVLGGGVLFVALALLVGSWWFLAARAAEATALTARVTELEADLDQVHALAESLVGIEEAYENIRSLFGSAEAPGVPFLPSPGAPAAPASAAEGSGDVPSAWPLTERGFLTQPLLEEAGSGAEHPGIDIAVPAGSYIRAAGGGVVVEVGEDPVYGQYVILDHAGGYRSLYAHASQLTVTRGETVVSAQVIGLTGSSGRSTAPHLHFEILRDGEPIDPLEIVQRP